MGFLKKLLGIGITAGATVAAVRVADKYKENNPNGVGDVNGDGKVDAKDMFEEVKKAATEVYQDATSTMSQKAPEYAQKAKETAETVVEKAKDVVTDTFGTKTQA